MGGYRLQCLRSQKNLIPSTYGRLVKATFAGGERQVWELPLSFETMQVAFNKGYIDIPFITKDEILDKNGRDGLSKALAMLQLTWFIIQIAARIRQGLAVTELELTTAALASLNIAMYISWWSKPTDIQCPTVITTKGLQDQDRIWMHNVSLPSSRPADRDKSSSSLPERAQFTDEPRTSSPLPDDSESSADDVKTHYLIGQVVDKERVNLVTHYWDEFTKALRESLISVINAPAKLVIGLIGLASEIKAQIGVIWGGPSLQKSTCDHKSAVNDSSSPSKAYTSRTSYIFAKKVQRTISLIWETITHLFLAVLYYPILAILGSRRKVEKTGSGSEHEPITPDKVENMSTVKLMFNMEALCFVMNMVFFCEDVASAPFFCLSAFSGAIFGMIHCLAWNFEFPSTVEQVLWRTSSSIISSLCIFIMIASLGYIIYQYYRRPSPPENQKEAVGNPDSPGKRTSLGNPTKATSLGGQSKLTFSESPCERVPHDNRDEGTTHNSPTKGPPQKNQAEGISQEEQAAPQEKPVENRPSKIIEIACSVFAICFVLTRFSLISLSVIGLRSLPASAFDTVQWSGFIPHI